MPSSSFSALCGCRQNTNYTWNCDPCGFLFVSIPYPLLPQPWPPLWYVCCVPAHLHTCLPSSQQKRYENTALSEFDSSRVITLLPSHYLASVASNSIFFVNLLNYFNQRLFNTSAKDRNILQRPPQSTHRSHPLRLLCHCNLALTSATFYFPFLWNQPLMH